MPTSLTRMVTPTTVARLAVQMFKEGRAVLARVQTRARLSSVMPTSLMSMAILTTDASLVVQMFKEGHARVARMPPRARP